MADASDPTPIANEEQFKRALLAVRDRMTAMQLAMLQAHCGAPDHAISASQLATAMHLDGASKANLHYGKLAHWIADELHYTTDLESKNKFCWWRTLAHGRSGGNVPVDGDYEWIMRPELVAILTAMKWA